MKEHRPTLVALVIVGAIAALAILRLNSEAVLSDLGTAETVPHVQQTESKDVEQSRVPFSASTPAPEHVSARTGLAAVALPHGRVIDKRTKQPIQGITVQMTTAGKVIDEVTTGADGAFSLAATEGKRPIVKALSDEWRFSPGRYRLDAAQHGEQGALLFEAERIVAAPLGGEVIDKATGEPVPDFLLIVQGPTDSPQVSSIADQETSNARVRFEAPPKRSENATTDVDGRFASVGGFEAGKLEFLLVDHSRYLDSDWRRMGEAGVVVHQHHFSESQPPKDAVLEIDIGPTYRLQVALPEGTNSDDFFATFPMSNVDLQLLHRTSAESPGSAFGLYYGKTLRPGGLDARAPLRAGIPPWTRFRKPLSFAAESAAVEAGHALHLRSHDGFWSGVGAVTSFVGVQTPVVPIVLEERGVIDGVVLDPAGEPVPTAWVRLVLVTDSTKSVQQQGVDRRGRFDFKWVLSGEYELIVETQRFREWRSAVDVVSGESKSAEVRLTSAVPIGSVSGALRTSSGQHRSLGGVVTLQSLDDAEFLLIQQVRQRRQEGEPVAQFRFDNVPYGDYALTLKPQDNRKWTTLRQVISAPSEGLEFVCEDGTATFDIELRPVDAVTGTQIDKFWHILWLEDPLLDRRLDMWDAGFYKSVPEGVPLHWMVHARGYRLASGDEGSLRVEGASRVVEAALEPGWGQAFHITTRQIEPLAGVELIADGREVGISDPNGMVFMNLDAKPSKLEFRYKDWVVDWGTIDPNDEYFGWGPETPVYLKPRE